MHISMHSLWICISIIHSTTGHASGPGDHLEKYINREECLILKHYMALSLIHCLVSISGSDNALSALCEYVGF